VKHWPLARDIRKKLDANGCSFDSNNAAALPCEMQKTQFDCLQEWIHTG